MRSGAAAPLGFVSARARYYCDASTNLLLHGAACVCVQRGGRRAILISHDIASSQLWCGLCFGLNCVTRVRARTSPTCDRGVNHLRRSLQLAAAKNLSSIHMSVRHVKAAALKRQFPPNRLPSCLAGVLTSSRAFRARGSLFSIEFSSSYLRTGYLQRNVKTRDAFTA